MKHLRSLSVGLSSLAFLAAACSAAPGASEDVAQASAELTNVPSGIVCVQLVVTNTEGHSVTDDFTVTTSATQTLTMSALPAGPVLFEGFAYTTACAQVTSASAPTWASPPTAETLASGANSVEIVLQPVASAVVGVAFCTAPEVPCPGGACVNMTSDPNNCGGCGVACSAATPYCVNSECSVSTCGGDLVLCGGVCTSLDANPQNCGACGNECSGGTVCKNRECTCPGLLCE